MPQRANKNNELIKTPETMIERALDNIEFIQASSLLLYAQSPKFNSFILKVRNQFIEKPQRTVTKGVLVPLNDEAYAVCLTKHANNLSQLIIEQYKNPKIKKYRFPILESKLEQLGIVSYL